MTSFAPPPPNAPSPSGDAEIFDRGYRRYEGERTGVGRAMRSVYVDSLQRALGLRRRFRFKIVPLLTIAFAYIPAIGFMAATFLIPNEFAGEIVDYAGYYALTSISVVLLTAFVAPELLCTDRRTGMFGLYMASPLQRWHYLAARAGALATVLFLVTLVPVLVMLLGYTFLGLGPEGFTNTIKLLGRILAGGLILSGFFSLLGMAAASFTDRKGFASAGLVMSVIASAGFAEALRESAEAPDWVSLIEIGALPNIAIQRLFGSTLDFLGDVSNLQSTGALIGAMVILAAVVIVRYMRMEVVK